MVGFSSSSCIWCFYFVNMLISSMFCVHASGSRLQLAWLGKPAPLLLGELRSNLVLILGNTLDRHLELDHHPAAGLVFDHLCVSLQSRG